MRGEIVALHVHFEVPPHQDRDVPVVGPQRGHKVQELLQVGGPLPQGGVVVPPVPGQPYKAGVDVLLALLQSESSTSGPGVSSVMP